ncbi:hypothetical protein BJX99DRAFT_151031 [Aspergillus californicus]
MCVCYIVIDEDTATRPIRDRFPLVRRGFACFKGLGCMIRHGEVQFYRWNGKVLDQEPFLRLDYGTVCLPRSLLIGDSIYRVSIDD